MRVESDCRMFRLFGEGRSMTQRGVPELFCVELRTARWAELVEWYRSVLGLAVLVRVVDDGYALLGAGDCRIAILSRPEPGSASGRMSLGFETSDLDAVERRLAEAGADVRPPRVHAEGFRELLAHDPDGNKLRLFSWPNRH